MFVKERDLVRRCPPLPPAAAAATLACCMEACVAANPCVLALAATFAKGLLLLLKGSSLDAKEANGSAPESPNGFVLDADGANGSVPGGCTCTPSFEKLDRKFKSDIDRDRVRRCIPLFRCGSSATFRRPSEPSESVRVLDSGFASTSLKSSCRLDDAPDVLVGDPSAWPARRPLRLDFCCEVARTPPKGTRLGAVCSSGSEPESSFFGAAAGCSSCFVEVTNADPKSGIPKGSEERFAASSARAASSGSTRVPKLVPKNDMGESGTGLTGSFLRRATVLSLRSRAPRLLPKAAAAQFACGTVVQY